MSKLSHVHIIIIAILALPLISLHALPLAVYAQERLDVDTLAKDFYCSCGCNYLLSVCESQMTCSVASNMKAELGSMIDQGMTRDEIVNDMTSRYGNTVLALPPMTGFTLALWWYPVIGGAVGVVVIAMVARRRSGVNWRIDPDEVLALNEDELLKQIKIDESAAETTASKKYDDILKERLKKAKP